MEDIRMSPSVSIIIPAKDEAISIGVVVAQIIELLPGSEVIVVNDGSSDATAQVAEDAGAHVVTHPYSMGNGAAVKRGARTATKDILITMDGDGQHNPADIPRLLERLEHGYDMVVGARTKSSQASIGRSFANRLYNYLASTMTGQNIQDLTSGFRAVRRSKFLEFIHLLPNGFSYPTTITMAFFRSGYPVTYESIVAAKREGKSHIRPLKDGMRFLLIIFKVGTLYSPLKIFVPTSMLFFTTGLGYYCYTLLSLGRFTNMSALLLTTAVIIFLIGLVSEQISSLIFSRTTS
jgi:glycosyltransferase involved in cell wall biosynthesis